MDIYKVLGYSTVGDFERARTSEQKEARMAEIKKAASDLFDEVPYSEITLTTIAKRLSWTRANLYRYVSTKEEIFLDLIEERMRAYYADLDAAFKEGCSYSLETTAEVWAGIIEANQQYFMMGHIMWAIVETNVTPERLVEFRKGYIRYSANMLGWITETFGLDRKAACGVILSIYYHGAGQVCSAFANSSI